MEEILAIILQLRDFVEQTQKLQDFVATIEGIFG